MQVKNKKEEGFSLIEIIIYIAIFSMLSLLIINSLTAVMSSFSAVRTNIILEEAGVNSMGRISREIRKSNSIDLVNSDLANGVLQLNTVDDSGNPMVLKFSKENNKLYLYKNGILSGNLLSSNVTLENLVFYAINTTHSQGIKIDMTIKNNYGHSLKQVSFHDTLILRGSYK